MKLNAHSLKLMKFVHSIWWILNFSGRAASFSLPRQRQQVNGVDVHRMPLSSETPCPYCFAAASIIDLNSTNNFLATQVWPSARFAASAIQAHIDPSWNVCEFGCGPGMPSLTAAAMGCTVFATDFDEFALELVDAAALEQGLSVTTRTFDLIAEGKHISESGRLSEGWMEAGLVDGTDLVIFSDVFENSNVAVGAAHVTDFFLKRGARVWTFAQSDRAQRDVYTKELGHLLSSSGPLIFSDDGYDSSSSLWLCDLDETKIKYG